MSTGRFTLDPFQREAIAAVDRDHNVLVAAPTGSGKTVVAEHAVAGALASGGRAFYTTPIKALSNQKYADLSRIHGADSVGLLTGDNAVNSEAPIVVMTTEVLRNMIYASSSSLDGLRWVVLDEVHYLQDTYRGPVWEEVLVHAPAEVRFVCLSATVSNADELAGWIASARGETETVVEHERPVELLNHYLVHDKASGDLLRFPTLVGGRPNPEGQRFDALEVRGPRHLAHRNRARRRWAPPRRGEVVEHLAEAGLLPAIYFVFSRAGCDDACRALLDEGSRFTTEVERARIRAIAEHHVAHLDDADLDVLSYDRWLSGLESGVASHHAGLVPPFKEAVEACFVEGLVKVVFATETLALGINMPARSVVIESLSKFTGEGHEDLTPSQYTQLTGRAGRRGLDPVGHAMVLWSPWHTFDQVAALASSREYVLRSAFRPTYNMVVNLIRRYDREQAHELLGRSFAQYQADRSLARLSHRRARRAELLASAQEQARCERGDIDEYRELRRTERARTRRAREARAAKVANAVEQLAPGDVIRVGRQRLAVLSASYRKGTLRLRVVDGDARTSVLDADDFDDPPWPAGSVVLPEPYDPRNRIFQRHVASALRKASISHRAPQGRDGQVPGEDHEGTDHHDRSDDLDVARCPDLRSHLTAAGERDRLRLQVEDLDARMAERSGSLVRRFDQIHGLLERWDLVDEWTVTPRGEVLSRIFHEADLLCAVALSGGVFDDLSAPEMAAMASMLTYEHRSKEPPPPPWFPSTRLRDRAGTLERLSRRLTDDEERQGLDPTRAPDPGFVALAHAWAAGEDFEVVLTDQEMSAGDFVRNIKTLVDLLRQIGEVAPVPATGRAARAAAEALFRGVVAVSSEVAALDPPAGS